MPDWVPEVITAVIWGSWGMMTWTWLESWSGWRAVRAADHRLQDYATFIMLRVTALEVVLTVWALVATISQLVDRMPPWVVVAVGVLTPVLLAGIAWHEYRAMVRIYLDE